MKLNKKIGRIFKFVLSLTMAMAICIGNIIDINQIFKVSAAAVNANTIAASLTVHSDANYKGWGHSFISIKNKTNSTIYVLGVPVMPSGAITVGTWGDQKDKYGRGIFTNMEAYKIKYKGEFKKRVSLSMNITYSQLYTAQETMKTMNFDYKSLNKNCSLFAAKTWNSVATPKNKLSASNFLINKPSNLAADIMTKKGWKQAAQIGTCDKTDIRRILPSGGYIKVAKKDIK